MILRIPVSFNNYLSDLENIDELKDDIYLYFKSKDIKIGRKRFENVTIAVLPAIIKLINKEILYNRYEIILCFIDLKGDRTDTTFAVFDYDNIYFTEIIIKHEEGIKNIIHSHVRKVKIYEILKSINL